MRNRHLIAVVAAAFILNGCVSLSTPDLEQSWQGRFSASATFQGKQENHSGRFNLTHSEEQQTTILDLKSALGNTIARVQQTPDQATLNAVGSQTITAHNAESLLLQTVGFSVPVQGLQYWINGETVPGMIAKTQPQSRPYQKIEQNGWLIQYESYDNNGLPKRIRLQRRSTDTTPALSIVLLISERTYEP